MTPPTPSDITPPTPPDLSDSALRLQPGMLPSEQITIHTPGTGPHPMSIIFDALASVIQLLDDETLTPTQLFPPDTISSPHTPESLTLDLTTTLELWDRMGIALQPGNWEEIGMDNLFTENWVDCTYIDDSFNRNYRRRLLAKVGIGGPDGIELWGPIPHCAFCGFGSHPEDGGMLAHQALRVAPAHDEARPRNSFTKAYDFYDYVLLHPTDYHMICSNCAQITITEVMRIEYLKRLATRDEAFRVRRAAHLVHLEKQREMIHERTRQAKIEAGLDPEAPWPNSRYANPRGNAVTTNAALHGTPTIAEIHGNRPRPSSTRNRAAALRHRILEQARVQADLKDVPKDQREEAE